MKDRIRQIMEDQKLNQQSFAQLIGKSTATLSNIFNDRTKPTLDIVDAIKKKFPQVNTEWLLFGTPPMYINKVEGGAPGASLGGSTGAGSMGTEDSLDMYGGASASTGMGAQGGMPGAGGMAGGVAGGVMEPSLDFGADVQDSSPASPSLFDQPQMHGVKRTPKNIANAAVKIVDKPQRRITEIRIFYDDQTWETFVPKK